MPIHAVTSIRPTERDELAPSQGERNAAAKLTREQVTALRAAHAAGGVLVHLAAAFRISERAARHIVQRTTWRHI